VAPRSIIWLGHMGPEPPTVGQWWAWDARCRSLSPQQRVREDAAGTWARRLARAGEARWGVLDVPGLEATPTIAERAHRCGVLERQRRPGRPICRLRGRLTCPSRVEALAWWCKGIHPELSGLTQFGTTYGGLVGHMPVVYYLS